MRRSPELAPLSRDHQHALDAALRLRRADAGSVDAAVSHFQSFFASEGIRRRLPAVALARLGRAIDAAERSGGAQAPPG